MIQGYRGVGKSWISSAFVMWKLYMDPKLKFLVVSGGSQRAKDFTQFCKRLMNEMDLLKPLKPTSEQRNAVDAFDVRGSGIAHAPSVKAVGVTGQITGTRADYIVSDDIETLQNSITVGMREKLMKAVGEFTSVLKPDGHVIYLGTPQSQDSIYNQISATLRIYPVRYPYEEDLDNYDGCLAPEIWDKLMADPSLSGEPTDPDRFDEEEITKRALIQGNSTFQLQYMLNTSLSDLERFPLKVRDLIIADLSDEECPDLLVHSNNSKYIIQDLPQIGIHSDRFYSPAKTSDKWEKYQDIVMSIDPSGLGKDETAYAVVGYYNSKLFLLDSGGLKGGYEDSVLLKLAKTAKRFKVNQIIIENNFGNGMFSKLFEPILFQYHQCKIEEVRSTTQKEKRIIETLEPIFNQHKLVVSRNVVDKDIGNIESNQNNLEYSLFYQMTRLTADKGSLKHDDRLDALAMAVEHWGDMMTVNEEEMRKRKQEEELDNFINKMLGLNGGNNKYNVLKEEYRVD